MPQSVRGPILVPCSDGSVTFHRDGLLRWDSLGILEYVGPFVPMVADYRPTSNLLLPPFLDAHIHIPQWPIRGRFCDGVTGCPAEGRLLAGLNQNVFPFEAKCASADHTAKTVADFSADTLSKGVVGGAGYMTVHAPAAHQALSTLGPLWSVGLVLMNMNCPEYLRTDEDALDADVHRLAADFGRRFIVTDRFAVAVESRLRRRAAALAKKLGLRMQTHLDEQSSEKRFVERDLYPHYASYTDVYREDGLLDHDAILAHCIHTTDAELAMIAAAGARVAHCPTSNTLLGSGIMNVDRIRSAGLEYAICTDVGASPTTSMLHEMAQYLFVHAGRSSVATPSEALFRSTLAPARLLHCDDQVGRLKTGRPASFIEVFPDISWDQTGTADDAIAVGLLGLVSETWRSSTSGELGAARDRLSAAGMEDGPEFTLLTRAVSTQASRLADKVQHVVLGGRTVWRRSG